MSDLAATNCGCNDGGNNCCSIIWIIILLSLCGCGNNGSGFNFGNNGCGNDGCGCIWIILLLLFCGGGCNGNGFF